MVDNDLFKKAANPHQYDSPELDWLSVGQKGSASGSFFRSYLQKHLEDLGGNGLLEIGSGTGRLFDFLEHLGCKDIFGVEPSRKNIEVSNKLHPHISVFEGTLEELKTQKKFDIVLSVMAFEHIPHLEEALQKIAGLLKTGGRFYLIVGDKTCQTTENLYEEFEAQDIGDGSVVVRTKRPFGILCNIVRPILHYVDTANKTGLGLQKHVELIPTSQLLELEPKFNSFKESPLCHLLIFQRGK